MGSYTASTTFLTPKDIKRNWWIIDASDSESVGRLAARVAIVLRGKHKANYTPHINCGDHVVIINAEKALITGNKRQQKVFYWHTGHPGGIKERTWDKILTSKYPERLLRKAIQRMLPKESPLATEQFKKLLHIYVGSEHPHTAQNPQQFKFFKEKNMTQLNKEPSKIYATGRRKSASARVWIKKGSGKFSINNRTLEDYFGRSTLKVMLLQPFAIAGAVNEYDVECTVEGSGLTGQAGAIRHGISRALDAANPVFHVSLKSEGLLTRDKRVVERKKFGRKKARRRFQFCKR